MRDDQAPAEDIDREKLHLLNLDILLIIGIIGLGLCQIVNALMQVSRFKANGLKYFTNVNANTNFFNIIMNSVQISMVIMDMKETEESGLTVTGSLLKYQRNFQTAILFLFTVRIFYFMSLVDEISPLVDIIFKVFEDIKYFMMVFVLSIFLFTISFFLLGQN